MFTGYTQLSKEESQASLRVYFEKNIFLISYVQKQQGWYDVSGCATNKKKILQLKSGHKIDTLTRVDQKACH